MLTNKNWNCSMSRVLDVVGGKWRMNILWVINKHKRVRFNQLRREVEGITTISLTRGFPHFNLFYLATHLFILTTYPQKPFFKRLFC